MTVPMLFLSALIPPLWLEVKTVFPAEKDSESQRKSRLLFLRNHPNSVLLIGISYK